ncbi:MULTISPECIES: ABC transporter ATP-binding protein [Paracoccus]|uniref:ABC transporter ATP-binding protein n=1 Tax=Paracoccus TaxID=265 RepID=UPI000CEBD0F6|nr:MULTISPECIES: ABC transporter ATP-binding protein [Paracoccus]UFS67307.1 ABC transporter ATP-binding protein/permease [Paracoccus denitrificans]
MTGRTIPAGRPGPTAIRETWRQLQDSVGEDAPRLRAAILGLLLAAALQGLALAAIAPVIVAAFDGRDWPGALRWLGICTILMIAATATRWWAQGFDFNGRMAAATHRVRLRLGEQMRRMPLETLHGHRTGELNSVVINNVDENLLTTLTILNLIFISVVTPLVTGLALLALDWRAGLLILVVFPAILPLYRWRRPAIGRGKRILGAAHQQANADVLEYTQGLPVLRAALQAGARAGRLERTFRKLEEIQIYGHRKGEKPNLIVSTVVEVGLVLMLGLGVAYVVAGTMDLALFAALLVIVVRLSEPLATFILYTAILELVEAALDRIKALLAIAPLDQALPARTPAHCGIRFEAASFAYAGADAPALRDVDLTIPEGSLTALVGPSGSGKTTLARLILRHADPQKGRILIGGADLRQIPESTLRGMLSVVFQDVHLFNDTVMANIRMARPDATEAEVREAARAAQCLDFIERLPLGWDTPLGEIGSRLSGGERQRISIARALLKDAPILILDEPTAALDTESERAVQRAIDAVVRDRTVIVIAHRLSTIAGADQIAVVDDGRIVQLGTHSALLAQPGRYLAMWEAQQAAKIWSGRA